MITTVAQAARLQTKPVTRSRGSPDLEASIGDEVIRVEVKGSTITRTTVDVTSGEVDAALDRGFESALIVVDQIPWSEDLGSIKTEPGRLRVRWEWEPEPERLMPTSYRYLLPPMEEQ